MAGREVGDRVVAGIGGDHGARDAGVDIGHRHFDAGDNSLGLVGKASGQGSKIALRPDTERKEGKRRHVQKETANGHGPSSNQPRFVEDFSMER